MTMAEYRDFVGILSQADAEAYQDRRAYVDTTRYSQVYMATHKGENYLPFMNRSFISFSFGGKNIEDYNLIATISGDRLERDGSAEFEDLVDSYNIIDGQFYWGTHFKPNKISFKLATDGITQRELDEFLYWFQGGRTRELILAEHPNRAILARVSAPPQIELLPFEDKTTVMVGGTEYKTSTTLYKGEISLEFIMDEPFWYSKINIFGHCDDNGVYHDEWVDANGNTINIYNSYQNLDVIKIILEDNIPTSSMITASMLLGNNVFANIEDNTGGRIAKYGVITKFLVGETENDATVMIGEIYLDEPGELTIYLLDDQLNDINNSEHKNHIVGILLDNSVEITGEETMVELAQKINTLLDSLGESELDDTWIDTDPRAVICKDDGTDGATIAGPHMASNTGINSLSANTNAYFYYAGTAPSYPVLQFSTQGLLDSDYIVTPANSYNKEVGRDDTYSTITIASLTSREFRFTTPNLYTSYNEVIKTFKSISEYQGQSWEVIRSLIRDNVKHYAVRAWASHIIDYYDEVDNHIISINSSSLITLMNQFLLDENGNITTSTFIFDGENGKSTGTLTFREYSGTVTELNPMPYIMTTVEEDVSDMLKSNYLVITDRNHPDANGNIVQRLTDTDYHKTYSHILSHDVSGGIKNLFIRYKNMYL